MTSDVVKSNRPVLMKANKTVVKQVEKRLFYYHHDCCVNFTESLRENIRARSDFL